MQSEAPAARRGPVDWIKLAIPALVLVGMIGLYAQIDESFLRTQAARVSGWVVFVAMVFLPLLGFPVSVLHVVAGIRFGVVPGITLVTLSIFLQLLASYALVHANHDAFARRFDALRRRVPLGAHRSVTVFTLLLPGVPYFAKNYVLPLVGVPLRTYLAWAFPIHAARSAVAVVFGDQTGALTPMRIGFFAIYFVVVASACTWSFVRLREQLHNAAPREPA